MSPAHKKNKLSREFINKLAEVSAGYLPPETFEKVIALFEEQISGRYFSYSIESNMLRIILAMYDKVSFFNDCIIYPHYAEILVSISAISNYLIDILVRNPEYFYWVVNPSNLENKLEQQNLMDDILKSTSAFKSFGARLKALRLIKRKETLRIGTKDIFNKAPLEEITGDLSVLAKTITSVLFDLCYREILTKYNLSECSRKYTLMALGKLGGNELNYSSDIDLMIFYDEDEDIESKQNGSVKSRKTYQEILIETIYLFIESATQITGAGYIFRVDFRLRPDGRNSPLTRTIAYYLNYYESRGEDWEKQMLIKSSFVAGDVQLYNSFMSYLTPFIYPSAFSISPTEQIKRLKISIEKKLDTDENIKLSAGGIRDIEFSVQALQLLYGGKIKVIRTPNTLEAISRLSDVHLLSLKEADNFRNAYIFYRRIEHFLQLMNDKQTHTIPSEGEVLKKLSSYTGFISEQNFKAEVKHNRSVVGKIYNSIMGGDTITKEKKKFNIPFENTSRAGKDLLFLREGKGLMGQRQFDKDTVEAFNHIEDTLMEFLQESINPDQVLQNFTRIIRSEGFPSIWYKEFTNKKFFMLFLNICSFSQKAVDLFAEDEQLRESFLTRKTFEKYTTEELGQFTTKKMLFILLAQYTSKLLSAQQISSGLTDFFVKKIEAFTPYNNIKKSIKTDFFIAGMGSFGSGDFSFASDIDLIFVAEEISPAIDVQKYFQSLFLKFQEEFKPFEIDCRLRPEGKSSWLAWDMKNYEHYLYNRARVWELQAFSKIRFVTGNEELYKNFLKVVKKRIEKEDKIKIKKELVDMRRKLYPQAFSSIAKNINIKKSKGGITDIEFLLQYLVLSNPAFYLKCSGISTVKAIDKIVNANSNYSDIKVLKDNFKYLKNIELSNQSIFSVLNNVLPSDEKKLRLLAAGIGEISSTVMMEKIYKVTRENQSLFEKYTGV